MYLIDKLVLFSEITPLILWPKNPYFEISITEIPDTAHACLCCTDFKAKHF